MCFSAPKVSIPAPPSPPPPPPESPESIELRKKELELANLNLEELRRAKEESEAGRRAFEELTGTPYPEFLAKSATRQKELTDVLMGRYEKAAKGELPVSPGLERSLGEEEQQLKETLRRNLGPGYETSEPGIRALREFSQRRQELREGARTGELTRAEQLGYATSPLAYVPQLFSRRILETPPQLPSLQQQYFANRALEARTGELGYQGALNYQNLLSQAAASRSASQGNMLNSLFGLGEALGGAAILRYGI